MTHEKEIKCPHCGYPICKIRKEGTRYEIEATDTIIIADNEIKCPNCGRSLPKDAQSELLQIWSTRRLFIAQGGSVIIIRKANINITDITK